MNKLKLEVNAAIQGLGEYVEQIEKLLKEIIVPGSVRILTERKGRIDIRAEAERIAKEDKPIGVSVRCLLDGVISVGWGILGQSIAHNCYLKEIEKKIIAALTEKEVPEEEPCSYCGGRIGRREVYKSRYGHVCCSQDCMFAAERRYEESERCDNSLCKNPVGKNSPKNRFGEKCCSLQCVVETEEEADFENEMEFGARG